MSLYAHIPQFIRMLGNLERWLDKGVAFAKAKSFDPVVLLNSRLAPDQYPLMRQIQSACDRAKFSAARLTGQQPPRNPDTEQTLDEIRARIRGTIAYLETFKPEDFAGAESRIVELPHYDGLRMVGSAYMLELQLPDFYFHATTAYAILRHNGVDLGKDDYIGELGPAAR
jgi:hypothetical protein